MKPDGHKFYDFIHFFLIDSPVFNTSVQEIINSSDYKYKHLFVYRYESGLKEYQEVGNEIIDNEIGNAGKVHEYLSKGKWLILHSLSYSNHEISKVCEEDARQIIWCVWGSDLYDIKKKHTILYTLLRGLYRKMVHKEPVNEEKRNKTKIVNSFRGIVIGFKGDKYELCKQYSQDIPIYNALYPSGYYIEEVEQAVNLQNGKHKNIQVMVGHCGYAFLQHKKCLKRLLKYKEYIDIHIPLCYGDMEYAGKVQKYAYTFFKKERVHIYHSMMSPKNYIRLLNSMDFVLFDFNHQAAFGNIILLLYLEKNIYLSPSGVMYKNLKAEGIDVFDITEVGYKTLNELTGQKINEKGKIYARNLLDRNYITNQWLELFDAINSCERIGNYE